MTIQFPNPAVMEVNYTVMADPVTQTEEAWTGTAYLANVAAGPTNTGWSVGWDDADTVRGVILTQVTDEGDAITGVTERGTAYRFREVDTYDALAFSAVKIPQPLDVVKAEITRGGVVAQQLDAVVAGDNTVTTLMLETGMGTFVRYSGDWQKLSENSESLEDQNIVTVAASALAVWDAADAAGVSLSVFDLPMETDTGEIILPEGEPDVETAAAMAASGISIPQISSVDDLDLGIRYGNAHPAARWYVTKRAHALQASAKIPATWNVAGPAAMPPFSPAAAETAW